MLAFLGPWEILILVVLLLLIFGARRLPQMGRELGRGAREFKRGISGGDDTPEDAPEAERERARRDETSEARR